MNAQVFINFSSPREQVLALRIQALGSASGISVHIPQVFMRQPGFELVPPLPTPVIAQVQLVIGIALHDVTQGFHVDMEFAKQMSRPILVFAGPLGAAVLVDDLWARGIAKLQGIPYFGSFGVIRSLFEIGVLDKPSARFALHQMKSSGCFLPLPLVNEFLLSIGEEGLQ